MGQGGAIRPAYAAASAITFVSLATRLGETTSTGFEAPADFVVPPGDDNSVEIRLLHGGVPVPGWSIVYLGGEGGIKLLPAPPAELFAVNEDFALEVISTGFSFLDFGLFIVSATIGTV
jgi:hypothetical protein